MIRLKSSTTKKPYSLSLFDLSLSAGLAVFAIACGGQQSLTAVTEEKSASEQATLSEAELEELKREYPVLRKEPAPAPKPSPDANPENVPGEIRQALSRGVLESVSGGATFYADKFEGRRTASGIPFRQNQMVAAHPSYPFGTILRVTNERNGKSVNVRVVDRGPFGAAAKKHATVVDLSRRAAEQLDFIRAGRTQV
ncbi:MAG: septal ring lytic transglycosylase RlpA family protein, partial [Acidobacteria bacterium]|nr:septal ring lytic transglycosylase RlpA family protein [Acidobacteriota bacterium]